ncbi:syncollin [Passerculus sandwichensis]
MWAGQDYANGSNNPRPPAVAMVGMGGAADRGTTPPHRHLCAFPGAPRPPALGPGYNRSPRAPHGPGRVAQCPAPTDLRPANGTRLCALLYADNSPYYEQCCAGDALEVLPNADLPYLPVGWAGRASSLVVGARCELTVWSRRGKGGKTRRFAAGAVPRLQEVKRGLFGNWNDAIRALYCTCK